jgi:hypothetical protein
MEPGYAPPSIGVDGRTSSGNSRGARVPPSRFATLGSLNRGDDDDDEDQGKQNFFAGGEKSYTRIDTLINV